MNNKANYTGLLTQRQQVECQPLMATSSAKVKVKTDVSTENWKEEEIATPLETTITTRFDD